MNLNSGHGRTFEFPDVYMTIDGYSARVIRELYTHIGGAPTRLQASTRYIDYKNFDYIIPYSIEKNEDALAVYKDCMKDISEAAEALSRLGISKEDLANLYPLGMETKIVIKINLRTLMTMAEQRLCSRAYWEFRTLMLDIMYALARYSEEWRKITMGYFQCKCDKLGYCSEHKSCGKRMSKEEFNKYFEKAKSCDKCEDDLK